MLAAATMAVMLMGVMYIVFPADAVRDAEQLFDRTTAAYKAGTATLVEVGLANYHLFAMQYHSRQIPIASYCGSAKPLLQNTVNQVALWWKLDLDRDKLAAAVDNLGMSGRTCLFGIPAVEHIIYRDPPAPPEGASKEDYCRSTLPSLVAAAQKVEEAGQLGKKTVLDRIRAKRRLYEAKGFCASA
jgi:hypothetical protein